MSLKCLDSTKLKPEPESKVTQFQYDHAVVKIGTMNVNDPTYNYHKRKVALFEKQANDAGTSKQPATPDHTDHSRADTSGSADDLSNPSESSVQAPLSTRFTTSDIGKQEKEAWGNK